MSTDDRGVGEARRILGEFGWLRPGDAAAATITRLGGLTNLVFRVDRGAEHYVLRIPGKGTEEYINRRHEAQAARDTAAPESAPRCCTSTPRAA